MSPGPLGWVCTGCGRKIPGTIRSCRCGARRAETPSSGSSTGLGTSHGLFLSRDTWKTAGAAVGTALVLVTAGWLLRGGPSSEAESRGAESAEPVAAPGVEPAPASAADGDAPATGRTRPLEEVIEEVIPSVVSISSSAGRGSGFFIDHETVVTNYHVVGEDSYVDVKLSGGEVVSGRVEDVSVEWDLALIEARILGSDARGLPMAGSEEVRVGQDVLVIGSPLGVLENSVTRGIVSAIRSSEEITLLQIDAPINPGNSGGPVVDRYGRVIGIATMKAEGGESIGFAVASQHAVALAEGGPRPMARTGRQPEAAQKSAAPPNLQEMSEEEIGQVLDSVVLHYDKYYASLWQSMSPCGNLKHRFEGLAGDALRFELGRLVLEYADQRRIYARDSNRAAFPSWSDMSCLYNAERTIEQCYEGLVVYDEVYDEYTSRRAARGKAPLIQRYLPEI